MSLGHDGCAFSIHLYDTTQLVRETHSRLVDVNSLQVGYWRGVVGRQGCTVIEHVRRKIDLDTSHVVLSIVYKSSVKRSYIYSL